MSPQNRAIQPVVMAIVAALITPAAGLAIADQHGYALADLNLRIKDHSEWFADNIHPDAKGTTVLAAILYPILTGTGTAPGPHLAADLVFTGTKVELAWSADSAAYVLQGSPLLLATSSKWLIVEQGAYNDGQTVRVTNSITASRFFRLWQP